MANSRLERRQNVLKDAEAFTEAGIQHVGPSIGYWRGWRVQVPGNLRSEIRTNTKNMQNIRTIADIRQRNSTALKVPPAY